MPARQSAAPHEQAHAASPPGIISTAVAPLDTITSLTAFTGRGAGTDAERRAAQWLRDELSSPGRAAQLEPFWCRPNTALAQAWNTALGLAGGLVSVSHPAGGGVMVLVALICVVADDGLGTSPGRRLTPQRASQNVLLATRTGPAPGDRVRLILTANYDAGRMGLVDYRLPRRARSALRRLGRGRAPGWIGWLALLLVWLAVVAAIRLAGSHGTVLDIVQLPPTVALVLALALLLERGFAPVGPAASDNASGVAVVLALARALAAGPPAHLEVEVVLTGAGETSEVGLFRHLEGRRGELAPNEVIVLGFAACGAGSPRWWVSDGALLPVSYHARLRALCAEIAGAQAEPGAQADAEPSALAPSGSEAGSRPQHALSPGRAPGSSRAPQPHRGRGTTPALPARLLSLPAITLGCLDERGLAPRSHQPTDTATAIDRSSVDAVLGFALALVDEIDAEVAAAREAPDAPPAPAPGPTPDVPGNDELTPA